MTPSSHRSYQKELLQRVEIIKRRLSRLDYKLEEIGHEPLISRFCAIQKLMRQYQEELSFLTTRLGWTVEWIAKADAEIQVKSRENIKDACCNGVACHERKSK